jgi:tetratricopeptide (TPR) repeat protein
VATLDADQIQKIARGEIETAQILDINEDQMAAVLLAGYFFYENGKLPVAQEIFEGLLILDTGNPFVHAMLGSIYQKQEQFQLAFRHYSRAIQSFPQDIGSLINRGELFLRFGKFKEAADDFKAAIDLDPEQQNPSANRARLLSRLAQESLQVARDKGLQAALDEQNQLKNDLRAE